MNTETDDGISNIGDDDTNGSKIKNEIKTVGATPPGKKIIVVIKNPASGKRAAKMKKNKTNGNVKNKRGVFPRGANT